MQKISDLLNEQQEYKNYLTAIHLLENNNQLNENLLNDINSNIKHKIKFIKNIAKLSQTKFDNLLKLFKNKNIFKFFSLIKFSLKYFYKILKQGYKVYSQLEQIITSYVSNKNTIKWTNQELIKLDNFLESHPKIKNISGIAVSGLLLYIWLNMSFTPNLDYSMDFSDIFNALKGNYSISDLFISESGIQMLLYLATGKLLGLSFPWPGSQSTHLIIATIYGLR